VRNRAKEDEKSSVSLAFFKKRNSLHRLAKKRNVKMNECNKKEEDK
jgi:hypothetical protein